MILISRRAVIGNYVFMSARSRNRCFDLRHTPSFSCCMRIFLRATIAPLSLCFALWTSLYKSLDIDRLGRHWGGHTQRCPPQAFQVLHNALCWSNLWSGEYHLHWYVVVSSEVDEVFRHARGLPASSGLSSPLLPPSCRLNQWSRLWWPVTCFQCKYYSCRKDSTDSESDALYKTYVVFYLLCCFLTKLSEVRRFDWSGFEWCRMNVVLIDES